ncbi:hypothetical protein [Algoriphagus sp. C2-6-M1]|uniref:hypothetical protein n=1 Tax=Algoriphagus persicinus TaxID=3108754 RepID=UPI002B41795F|nr:hypothetical protein [Algoriphagus sp. C2-6-M1]
MNISKYKGGNEINTSHLKPGDYVISMFYQGKVINQQRIVRIKNSPKAPLHLHTNSILTRS